MKVLVLVSSVLAITAVLGYNLLSDYKTVKFGIDSYSCSVYNLPMDCVKRRNHEQ